MDLKDYTPELQKALNLVKKEEREVILAAVAAELEYAKKKGQSLTVLERLRLFLDSFETRTELDNAWEMLAGIRGPDNQDQWSKQFTRNIRAALSQKMFFGYERPVDNSQITKRYSEESEDEFKKRIAGYVVLSSPKSTRHFANHVAMAYAAIDQDLQYINKRDAKKEE